jgi:hypothetical protein
MYRSVEEGLRTCQLRLPVCGVAVNVIMFLQYIISQSTSMQSGVGVDEREPLGITDEDCGVKTHPSL